MWSIFTISRATQGNEADLWRGGVAVVDMVNLGVEGLLGTRRWQP